MPKRLSRKELYELVWSEPMKILAPRFGISDVALRKTCARAEIPTPGLGHWAKKTAGKNTSQGRSPIVRPVWTMRSSLVRARVIGIRVGTKRSCWPLFRRLPEFEESIERVRERIAKTVGKLTVPREVRIWHPTLDKLLKEDEQRRERQRASSFPSSWDAPRFDTPFERRRLRVLNTLVLAAGTINGKASISDHEGRNIHLSFHQRDVAIHVDRPKRTRGREETRQIWRMLMKQVVVIDSHEPSFGKHPHCMAG